MYRIVSLRPIQCIHIVVLKPQSSRCICTPFPVPWLMLACRSSCSRAFPLFPVSRGRASIVAFSHVRRCNRKRKVSSPPQLIHLPNHLFPGGSNFRFGHQHVLIFQSGNGVKSSRIDLIIHHLRMRRNRIIVCIDWLKSSRWALTSASRQIQHSRRSSAHPSCVPDAKSLLCVFGFGDPALFLNTQSSFELRTLSAHRSR